MKSTARTSTQYGYYFGVVLKRIAHELRISDLNEVHTLMKLKFNPGTFVSASGNKIRIPLSTRTLTREQFSNYVEWVVHWANDMLGIEIPPPEEIT